MTVKSKILPVSIILFVLLFSCEKNDLSDIEYFAFGTAYGMCYGNCANFFLIKDNNLYPDNMTYFISDSLIFSNVALPGEKYDIASKLIKDFPEYLERNPDLTFGCPDCHDQGGIHIKIIEKGQPKWWHIDTDIIQQPDEIKPYVKEILDVIGRLMNK
jgi:hypothetical protein